MLLAPLLLAPRVLPAQALSPAEALQHFKTADGFEVQLFASEPDVRQPVTMTFDERGRMWVVQYLQYPNPAGLTPVEVDRYLRTKYDRVPEPPPRGPRGADKITILEDTDGDGRADKAKDFVTGLNLASALAIGDDGVYVGQAPYLLFYADRNHDDVPDGDPEVLLTGFGMEDAHAVVNSLQWGPDGWLYGAQGSTVTADIRGIGFQQGVWRYHPPTQRFELFSEGGGNTWGLDFDRAGQVIAGTNWGDAVCLHQVQGGYYVKGFSKHGPLHNRYTFGYFDHVKHTGHVGGHVTCGGIVYQGGAFPAAFDGSYIAANLLSNAVYWHTIEPAGSTVTTRFAGTLLETDDPWFRPIDCLTGPDGSVFVADWYDERANHVIPDDTWDKSNGRIWKIVQRGTPAAGTLDMRKHTSDQLVDLLAHANAWQRREARRLLKERRDSAVLPRLRTLIDSGGDTPLALEALWAFYTSGGWNEQVALELLDHPSADVRAWTVRLIGDEARDLSPAVRERLVRLASDDPSRRVASQSACTAKRLPGPAALAIISRQLRTPLVDDAQLPLLIWWAMEDKAVSDRDAVLTLFTDPAVWQLPLVQNTILERLVARYMAEQNDAGYAACARLLALAPPSPDTSLARIIAAMDKAFAGPRLAVVPAPLAEPLAKLWREQSTDPTVTRLALRLGNADAYRAAQSAVADSDKPQDERLALVAALGQSGDADVVAHLLPLLDKSQPEPLRSAALAALARFDNEVIARELLTELPDFSTELRNRALAALASRGAWAHRLVTAVQAGSVDPKSVSVDQIRQMLAHRDAPLAAAIEATWGKIRAATPGEKMAYVPVLGRVLNAGPGNREAGHALFTKHCGTCHTLFGEGNKVGPDLTTADRRSREALLLNILDPSGYVRPEFVAQTAVLNDGRVLTGLVMASSASEITLVDAKNQKSTIPRGEIADIQPSTQSLMPERLLEVLPPQEVRDLFAYLQSEGPVASAAGK
ncbi:MAG: PVC-type heme-binding CxxCH protein [Pirellulales bacterium]